MDDTGNGGGFASTAEVVVAGLVVVLFAFIRMSGGVPSAFEASASHAAQLSSAAPARGRAG
jgi:hypothetical protein